MNSADCSILLDDNIACLAQGKALLEGLTDELFTRPGPTEPVAWVGSHLRHCLDHYDSFFRGVPEGRMDYDKRVRDPSLETERATAIAKISGLLTALQDLKQSPADKAVLVKMDCGDNADESTWWSDSSLRRELQFLISHTVHHYALMVLLLKGMGVDVDPSFGVAPSTLRHLRSHAACAR